MLLPKNRLAKRRDFDRIHKYGQFFYFGAVNLKILRNNLKDARIGISIGLKYSKKAVERNKMKRQIREIARKNLTKTKGGFDAVIAIKKKGKEKISSRELGLMYKKALEKAKLI